MKCTKCGAELIIGINWTENRKKKHNCWCKDCYKEYKKQYMEKRKNGLFSAKVYCNKCNVLLEVDNNWRRYDAVSNYYVCIDCKNTISNKGRYRRGERGKMYKNKNCSDYLGVVIAERLLSKVFKNVEKMPHKYPGYDFICNRGYKVDVKSTVVRSYVSHGKNICKIINFCIKKNKIPDYFLCVAFDNREDLNPLYCWLIPGEDVNDKSTIGISPNNKKKLLKWKMYEVDLGNITDCCNTLRDAIVDVEYTPINSSGNRVLIESM